MKIQQLLDMRKVVELVGDGYLRERVHPDHPSLRVIGYTEKAQWERMWCHETLTCRGLIYEAGSGEVLARPWPKFFNHGEYGQDHLRTELDLSASVEVTDKMDGSLGIIFRNPFTHEWQVATRGSFDSDQARLANAELLPALLADGWEPMDGYTYLTEILFKENRIVLDYGDRRELSLLGGVHIETGQVCGPLFDRKWPGNKTESFGVMAVNDALAMAPRPNAEGLILRHRDGTMVKIKQEDYVRLHKLISNLRPLTIWEHLSTHDGDITSMIEGIPDEFHEWVRNIAGTLTRQFDSVKGKALQDYDELLRQLATGAPVSRKDFAELAKKNERPHLMFKLLDGRDLSEAIWKELRPRGDEPGLIDGRDDA